MDQPTSGMTPPESDSMMNANENRDENVVLQAGPNSQVVTEILENPSVDVRTQSKVLAGTNQASLTMEIDNFLNEKGGSITILNTNLTAGPNGIYYVILYKDSLERV